MRVAFLVTHFPVASETPFLNQVTGLLERGHDVRIYADAPSLSSLEHPDVERLALRERTSWPPPARGFRQRLRVVRAHWRTATPAGRRMLRRSLDPRWGRAARSLRLAHQVTRYLPGERFDVIQGCFGGDGIRAVRLRRIGVIAGPVVTAFRGTDVTRFLRRRGPRGYAELFRRGELFLPVSESLASELLAAGCPADRMRVHHTGIQLSQHPFRARALPVDRAVRFVSVGRLVEKKGIADALATVAALQSAGCAVEYHVVGDGPLQPVLESAAATLPPGLVRFHGAQLPDRVRALLDGMDVLLAPHRTAPDGDVEGIPNVLKEAMALGLPVVATRHGGIPELVDDGRSGLLASEGDIAGLVAHCRHLLDTPGAWPALAAAGRAAVEAGFDIDRLNDTLVELHRGLTLREPPGERHR